MEPGDLLLIRGGTHSYPQEWKRGEEPQRYSSPTTAIFISQFHEKATLGWGRTFYTIITPHGIQNIFSKFCEPIP
jgi:hypothetical protein